MSLTASILGAVALILSSSLPSVAFGPDGEFTGHWEGTMVREGVPLEVSFDFKWSETHPNGTFTSLTQKVMDYPLDKLVFDKEAVRFALGDSLVFDGKLMADQITGTFTDDSAKGDFILRRTVAKPPPYKAVDVSFHNGPVTLAATLCIPRSPGLHPAVVLLQGSVVKHAGALTALSRIGSRVQGLLLWSMTNERRDDLERTRAVWRVVLFSWLRPATD